MTGSLYRTLRSTNPIENLNGGMVRYSRNVKSWQGGAMILRWVATAVLHAQTRFRRQRGCAAMPALTALDLPSNQKNIDKEKRAA